jgi:opacity protein-like surface antigen
LSDRLAGLGTSMNKVFLCKQPPARQRVISFPKEKMMKKVILVVALTGVIFGAANANAITPYVSFGGGVSWLADTDLEYTTNTTSLSYDAGYVVRGAAGVAFNKMFRLEVEGYYNSNDGDNVNVANVKEVEIYSTTTSATGALVNGYYDFDFGSPIVPFLTAGAGIANVQYDIRDRSRDQNVFAYAFGAGVAYAFNEKFSLDLAYRYFATEDVEFDDFTTSYEDHQLLLGARISF